MAIACWESTSTPPESSSVRSPEAARVSKPGWVRVNFNYFIDEKVIDFVISAVHLVADLGWRLLPQYGFDAWTALWRHRTAPAAAPLSLFDLELGPGGFAYSDRRRHEGDRQAGRLHRRGTPPS